MKEFFSSCEYQFDELTLKICKPFETRAAAIRYKRADPEGYKSDKTIRHLSYLIKFLDYKSKSKKLKEKDLSLLVRIDTALVLLHSNQRGKKWPDTVNLREKIKSLLPEEITEQITKIDTLLTSELVTDMLKQVKEESSLLPILRTEESYEI